MGRDTVYFNNNNNNNNALLTVYPLKYGSSPVKCNLITLNKYIYDNEM